MAPLFRRWSQAVGLGLLLCLLAACATAPGGPGQPAPPLADHLFKPAAETPDASAVMALTPRMREHAQQIRLHQRGHVDGDGGDL